MKLECNGSQFMQFEDISLYENKKPEYIFLFNETVKEVGSWRDVLYETLELLTVRDIDEELYSFNTTKRMFFSYNKDDINTYGNESNRFQLSNGLYVSIVFSAKQMVEFVFDILERCGYSKNDILFKFREE